MTDDLLAEASNERTDPNRLHALLNDDDQDVSFAALANRSLPIQSLAQLVQANDPLTEREALRVIVSRPEQLMEIFWFEPDAGDRLGAYLVARNPAGGFVVSDSAFRELIKQWEPIVGGTVDFDSTSREEILELVRAVEHVDVENERDA